MPQKNMARIAWPWLAVVCLVVGCSAAPDASEEEETASGSDQSAVKSSGTVMLKYEGTCEFLRTCSGPSANSPAGTVNWGCTGRGACDDDELWVAGPTRGRCGHRVRFCRSNGTCVTATVRDVSVSQDWEASNGVLDALGLPHGLTSRCGGFGGGRVTVTVL